MAQPAKAQEERRRVERLALRLTATMRDGTKSRVKARVIDMSTHGCRVECTSNVGDDSWQVCCKSIACTLHQQQMHQQ